MIMHSKNGGSCIWVIYFKLKTGKTWAPRVHCLHHIFRATPSASPLICSSLASGMLTCTCAMQHPRENVSCQQLLLQELAVPCLDPGVSGILRNLGFGCCASGAGQQRLNNPGGLRQVYHPGSSAAPAS